MERFIYKIKLVDDYATLIASLNNLEDSGKKIVSVVYNDGYEIIYKEELNTNE